MKYFYYPNGYFDINYIQMFLLNKKRYSQEAAETHAINEG